MLFNREKKHADQQHDNVHDMVGAALSRQSTPQAQGATIGYAADLIPRFQQCHVALHKLFTAMRTHAERDEFVETLKALRSFRRLLTGHLLEENFKLYSYLTRCLDGDPDNRELMLAMKMEMGKIGTTVVHFLDQYAKSGITPFNKQKFLKELDDIGAIFADRLEREETSLYTLYMPPEAFA